MVLEDKKQKHEGCCACTCLWAGAKYPFRAASYTSLTVNLEKEGWSQELLAAGFDPATPSVWLAEGLVMYLSEAAVGNLLREAHKVSAQGSRLLVMVRHLFPGVLSSRCLEAKLVLQGYA